MTSQHNWSRDSETGSVTRDIATPALISQTSVKNISFTAIDLCLAQIGLSSA